MRVLGIVSDGDLARRAGGDIGVGRSWWLDILAGRLARSTESARRRAVLARDVMSSPVVTATEDAKIGKIADALERHRIKRVPIVRDGRLVGIIGRSDIVKLLAALSRLDPAADPTDEEVRAEVLRTLERHASARPETMSVRVSSGIVELRGIVGSAEERRASRTAVADVSGVKRVADHRSIRRFSVIG
jgi:CBS domain-containing protein